MRLSIISARAAALDKKPPAKPPAKEPEDKPADPKKVPKKPPKPLELGPEDTKRLAPKKVRNPDAELPGSGGGSGAVSTDIPISDPNGTQSFTETTTRRPLQRLLVDTIR